MVELRRSYEHLDQRRSDRPASVDSIQGAGLPSQEILCGVGLRTADYVNAPRNEWDFFSDAYGTTRVCIASICNLVYWNRARDSHDLTFEIWPVALCTQAGQCMSIASFSFLYLKPLFEILDSGFIRSDEFRRTGQLNPEGSYNLSTMSSGNERRKKGKELARLARTGNNDTTITALENGSGWDGGSQGSEAHIIKETRTFTIESSAAGEDRGFP